MNIKNIRKIRQRKKEMTTEEKLNLYWRKHKGKLNPIDLIYIVMRVDHFLTRKRAFIEFLTRRNLNFDHFYRMSNAAKDVLEDNKKLKSQFWKDCFGVCNEDNLLELAEIEVPEAIKEIFRKIETSSNRKALQILIRFFEKNKDSEIRAALLKKIKKRGPSTEDLKYLLALPSMYALPKITAEIQKLLKKQGIEKSKKTIRKIVAIITKKVPPITEIFEDYGRD